jgi:hypothetical protein
MRVLELKSMLLGLLWPVTGLTEVSTVIAEPFKDPSALLLEPWAMGDSTDIGLTVVSPVRVAFAALIRNGASWPRARATTGDAGFGRPGVGCFWLDDTWEDNGEVNSVSPAVETERLLDEDGN